MARGARGTAEDLAGRCPHCTRTDWLAYVDETARNGLYGLAAVVVCPCRAPTVRKALRSQLRPGQRRIHFSKMRDRDRKSVLSNLCEFPIRIVFYSSRGDELSARRRCWQQLLPVLLKLGVTDLSIESIESLEHRDLTDISQTLMEHAATKALQYRHMLAINEPMLWAADASAWTLGRLGEATCVRDGQLNGRKNAKPDSPPSGEESGPLPQLPPWLLHYASPSSGEQPDSLLRRAREPDRACQPFNIINMTRAVA